MPTTVVSWPNTTPWQEEDRVWFEANPDRSHRLRDPWEAEVPELKMRVGGGEPAPGCKLQVLARQVEPGNRIRAAVVHDLGWPVDVDPNIEPLAHALFPKARHRNAAPSSA